MKYLRLFAIAGVASLFAAGCGNGFRSNAGLPPGTATDLRHRAPSGTIAEFSITLGHDHRVKAFPVGITNGPDDALWFTERGWGKLGRITTDGHMEQYSLKKRGQGPSFHPQNVTTGSDNNLWTTAGTLRTYRQISHGAPDPYGSIRRMTRYGKVTGVYKLPTKFSDARNLASGPDGNIWFTEHRGAIGEMATSGTLLNECPLQNANPVYPIIVGPDGNLWFGETFNAIIGRITMQGTQKCDITYFNLPKNEGPAGLTAGNDGYIYGTEFQTSKVAQITTDGAIIQEWSLPSGSYPKGIVMGSDGNLYVAEFATASIAEIILSGSMAGTIKQFPTPTPKSGPWTVVAGPDGNIWFTESLVDKIGVLNI